MSRAEREAFFEIYFWFILDDLRKMNAELPDSGLVATDLAFMEEHYREMKQAFKKKDFFFTLGFVLSSATRD